MDQAAVVPQFTYHQWPDQKPPAIQYKPRPLPYQLPSQYLSIPTGFSAPVPAIPLAAPLPFVWDPVNHDYFCYEPETTCFVYFKIGRVYYDEMKREHYRPAVPEALNFSKSYPTYRVYQNGEVMFYDPRRKDWYAYDLKYRRIVWRDQRWWPFPQKFSSAKLSPKIKPPKPHSNKFWPSPTYTAAPITAPKQPLKLKYKSDTSSKSSNSDDDDHEAIRVVEVKPDGAANSHAASWSGKSLKEIHSLMDERARLDAITSVASDVSPKEVLVLPDSEDESYELIPSRRRSSSSGKQKKHKGGIYDLEDLVARSMRKRRYAYI
ncbi:hypothetical protein HII31_07318 [Pseudocercospora fuligena]|uniref:Uncharacterized protein n=1 Tax=Pseudocercospora fuligena TaxID=685502 RepID=A0A8H6RG89_9PEZI|nr:hypothetical protein HII31_07318 [Pseudocercospora fuligena]